MGYGNRPTIPNNGYQNNGFNKNYNQKNNNFKSSNCRLKQQNNKQYSSNLNKTNQNSTKKNDNFTFKSDDDIYSPKVYAKKPKEKSMFDDIVIPEYIEDKQRMRNKRANDKKYKNKNRKNY